MRPHATLVVLMVSASAVLSQPPDSHDWPGLEGPYLGQSPPGMTAKVFAPGVVSGEGTQGYPSMSRGGEELFFQCSRRGGWVYSIQSNNAWQAPEVLPFSTQYGFVEASVSHDGSRLLFCSRHPHADSGNPDDLDLWQMERKRGSWQVPVPLDTVLNSDRHEAFPTQALSGNLYFFRDYEDQRGCDILVSRQVNGRFMPPEGLGATLNTEKHECDPFIDPHERYVVYCARDREGGFGHNDLYVSFRTRAGAWAESVNLGEAVNGGSEEITPHVSPDGRYLFFASNRGGDYDIYWVDARVVEKLAPDTQGR